MDLAKETRRLQEKMERVIQEKTDLKEKISVLDRLAEERVKTTEKDNEIQKLEIEMCEHAENFAKLTQPNSNQEHELESKGKRLEKLELEVKQAKEELEGKEMHFRNIEQMEQHQRIVEKFKKDEEEMKRKIVEEKREIIKQHVKISDLQMKIETVTKEKLGQSAKQENLHEELTELKEKFEEMKKAKEFFQNLQLKLGEEVTKYKNDAEENQKTIQAMDVKLAEYQERVKWLEEIVQQKQSQCDAIQKFFMEAHNSRIHLEEGRFQNFRNVLSSRNSQNSDNATDTSVENAADELYLRENYVGQEIEMAESGTSAFPKSSSSSQSLTNANPKPSCSTAAADQERSYDIFNDDVDEDDISDSDMSNFDQSKYSNSKNETDVSAEAQPFNSSVCNTKSVSASVSQIDGGDQFKSQRGNFCLCGKKSQNWQALKKHIDYSNSRHTFPCKKEDNKHSLPFTKTGCLYCGNTSSSRHELMVHKKSNNCGTYCETRKAVKAKSCKRKRCTCSAERRGSKSKETRSRLSKPKLSNDGSQSKPWEPTTASTIHPTSPQVDGSEQETTDEDEMQLK